MKPSAHNLSICNRPRLDAQQFVAGRLDVGKRLPQERHGRGRQLVGAPKAVAENALVVLAGQHPHD